MNKIRTYKDLVQEEQRLIQQLKVQEAVIREEFSGVRERVSGFWNSIRPVRRLFSTAQKMFTRDNRVPVFNIGLELIIDFILRRFILARAGWIAKSIVPYLFKNYSSHIMGEEKRKALVNKIRDIFSRIRPKQPKAAAEEFPGEPA